MKLAHRDPNDIREHHVSDWVNSKGDRVMSTRQVALACIRTFFSFLTAKRYCAADPSQLVSVTHHNLTHEQMETTERVPFTAAELKKLLDYISRELADAVSEWSRVVPPRDAPLPHHHLRLHERMMWLEFWQCAVQIASETGLRLGDIALLEWKSFEKAGRLVKHTSKTTQRVDVPISDEVIALITKIPASHDRYIFPHQAEVQRDVKRRSLMSVQFGRLCKSVGIEGKSFHCIRHTVATDKLKASNKEELARRLAESLSLKEIAALLGHSNTKTTKRYTH
jgi:integrase